MISYSLIICTSLLPSWIEVDTHFLCHTELGKPHTVAFYPWIASNSLSLSTQRQRLPPAGAPGLHPKQARLGKDVKKQKVFWV